MLAEAGDILSRNQVEAGQGLMIWITQIFPQMRSYLCIFYEILARPRATNVMLVCEQLHQLVHSLDEDLIIHANIPGVPRTPGTKLLQLKNEQVLNKADALRFRPSKIRTVGRVLDPRSRNVSMTDNAPLTQNFGQRLRQARRSGSRCSTTA